MKKIAAFTLALSVSFGSAFAQQWNDALTTLSSSPGWQNSVNPTGLPANEIFIQALGTNCSSGPSLIAVTPNQCPSAFGTSAVININQFARQSDLLSLSTQANRGIAMSLAMAGVAYLQPDEHIAFSGNWGTFQGENGGAVGVSYRLSEHVSVDGGFAGSFSGGTYGGRAGIRFGW